MSSSRSDPYAILGVSRGASRAELKSAFAALSKRLHPDVNPRPDATARFVEVKAAYDALRDPRTRAAIDRGGRGGSPFVHFDAAETERLRRRAEGFQRAHERMGNPFRAFFFFQPGLRTPPRLC